MADTINENNLGKLYYAEHQGDAFERRDAKGRIYRMVYAGVTQVAGVETHVYEARLVRGTCNTQERLLDRLDFCLHRYWGIEADPRYSYRGAVANMAPNSLAVLARQAEVTHVLMSRHAGQRDLVLSTYNKLVELLGMVLGTVFTVCPVSGILLAELMQ